MHGDDRAVRKRLTVVVGSGQLHFGRNLVGIAAIDDGHFREVDEAAIFQHRYVSLQQRTVLQVGQGSADRYGSGTYFYPDGYIFQGGGLLQRKFRADELGRPGGTEHGTAGGVQAKAVRKGGAEVGHPVVVKVGVEDGDVLVRPDEEVGPVRPVGGTGTVVQGLPFLLGDKGVGVVAGRDRVGLIEYRTAGPGVGDGYRSVGPVREEVEVTTGGPDPVAGQRIGDVLLVARWGNVSQKFGARRAPVAGGHHGGQVRCTDRPRFHPVGLENGYPLPGGTTYPEDRVVGDVAVGPPDPFGRFVLVQGPLPEGQPAAGGVALQVNGGGIVPGYDADFLLATRLIGYRKVEELADGAAARRRYVAPAVACIRPQGPVLEAYVLIRFNEESFTGRHEIAARREMVNDVLTYLQGNLAYDYPIADVHVGKAGLRGGRLRDAGDGDAGIVLVGEYVKVPVAERGGRRVDDETGAGRLLVDGRHEVVLPVAVGGHGSVDQFVALDGKVVAVPLQRTPRSVLGVVVDAVVAEVQHVRLARHQHARYGVIGVPVPAVVRDGEGGAVAHGGDDQRHVPAYGIVVRRNVDVEVGTGSAGGQQASADQQQGSEGKEVTVLHGTALCCTRIVQGVYQ